MFKIVTLIASATEIVSALGCAKQLVGISHECDYPPEILHLPRCTSTKFPTEVSSREIDKSVKDIVSEGLSVYRVDSEALRSLTPDIIITQTQCEVCAVSLKDVEAAVCETVAAHAKIVSLHPDALADIWKDIRSVANALGIVPRGEELVKNLQNRIKDIAERARDLPRRSVAYIEWIDPLMAGGNWMPELIELAGGKNLFGEAGKHSPWMTIDQLVNADPDVIVVAPCGFDIKRSLSELPVLTKTQEWQGLAAVKNSKVFVADGNQFFNRPGPRVVESLEILAELIHPENFDFGHRNNGWVKL